MTNPPTDQQLDQIEQRANAATSGPWGFYDGENYADVAADLQQTGPGSYSYREKIARLEDENYWDDQAHEDHDEERAPEQMAANAAFIAHAPEDVRTLLAEVRRLRARVTELEGPAIEARAALAALCYDLADPGSNALGALYLLQQATVGVDAPKDDAALALTRHAREVLHKAADMADPEEPEVSFFGDYGPGFAAWLRMIADRPAPAAAGAGVEPGTRQ